MPIINNDTNAFNRDFNLGNHIANEDETSTFSLSEAVARIGRALPAAIKVRGVSIPNPVKVLDAMEKSRQQTIQARNQRAQSTKFEER